MSASSCGFDIEIQLPSSFQFNIVNRDIICLACACINYFQLLDLIDLDFLLLLGWCKESRDFCS